MLEMLVYSGQFFRFHYTYLIKTAKKKLSRNVLYKMISSSITKLSKINFRSFTNY